jgi:hypothetical protein
LVILGSRRRNGPSEALTHLASLPWPKGRLAGFKSGKPTVLIRFAVVGAIGFWLRDQSIVVRFF